MTETRGHTDSPVFVVGIARSGTTLLAAMLSAHARLDCGPESRFFARYRHLDGEQQRRALDPTRWPDPAVEFMASLRNQGHPVVELFGLSIDEVRGFLREQPPSLAAMLESLTVLHAQRAGKARWVEKTPRHLLMTDALRRLWPAAAIVRIVRDPRDVALSLAGMPFAKDSVIGNLVRIDQDDRRSRRRIEADARAMTLRYEDLVSQPEHELRRICSFIGEDYDADMLDRRASAERVVAEHEWWKRPVAGPLETSRTGRWMREMEPDVQRFASLHLAAHLRRHRYEGARQPAGRVTIVPVADAVGPRNEQLLLDLARQDTVVRRPAPRDPSALRRQRRLVFLGTRGQLDPSAGRPALHRVRSAVALAALLALRRVRGRPVLWVRRATLRARRTSDPGELNLAAWLRLLARQVALEDVSPAVTAERASQLRTRPRRPG